MANLEKLNRSFIGFTVTMICYKKLSHKLPMPTYKKIITSREGKSVTLIYQLDRQSTTIKQWQFISDVKIGIKNFIPCDVIFEYECYLNSIIEANAVIYTLAELKEHFRAEKIRYPKIYYPATKKDLYRHLVWYGAKLYFKKIITREIMIATALKMNEALTDKLSYRELLKRADAAFKYVTENRDKRFKQRLSADELKEAKSRGGKTRGKQVSKDSEELHKKIMEALKDSRFIKKSGKPYISKIADHLGISRKTIQRHLNK